MARRRMIDPSFWDDPTVGTLSIPARLLFIGMVSHADDDGRLEVEPRYIRRAVFGFDEDISTADVARFLAEIREKCRNVRFYEVEGRALACFTNWRRYQYIQKKQDSRLPAPGGDTDNSQLSVEYDTDTVLPQSHSNHGLEHGQKQPVAAKMAGGTAVQASTPVVAPQSPETALPDQYDSDTVPVAPNRIEVNRREEKRSESTRARASVHPAPKPEPDPLLKHPAIIAYRNAFQLTPSRDNRALIAEQVTDLDRWQDTIRYWQSNNYRPESIGKMLDRYANGDPFPRASNSSNNARAPNTAVIPQGAELTMDEIKRRAAKRRAAMEAKRNGKAESVQVGTEGGKDT